MFTIDSKHSRGMMDALRDRLKVFVVSAGGVAAILAGAACQSGPLDSGDILSPPDRYIGRLGVPLGQLATIRGGPLDRDRAFTETGRTRAIEVFEVDGVILPQPIMFSVSGPIPAAEDEQGSFLVDCVEFVAAVGFPKGVRPVAISGVRLQGYGWQHSLRIYHEGELIEFVPE